MFLELELIFLEVKTGNRVSFLDKNWVRGEADPVCVVILRKRRNDANDTKFSDVRNMNKKLVPNLSGSFFKNSLKKTRPKDLD